MRIYRTLEGQTIDLSELAPTELAFFERLYEGYRARTLNWDAAGAIVGGLDNPVVGAAGRVTRDVTRHPLYMAARDLEDRIGLLEGALAAELDLEDPAMDPVEDEWITVREAATEKGVTVPAVHQAILRGEVVATPAKAGGTWKIVSRASLRRWTPDETRRKAGLARRRA